MAKNFEIKTIFRAVDKTSRVLGKIQTRMARFSAKASKSMKKINRAASKMSSTVTKGLKVGITATAGAVGALSLGLVGLMKQFSKVEDAQAAFTPVLGGAEDARKMVDMLNKTAASTPFQFETLASATQQLLPNMNKDMELTVKTLRMLGDTAGGNAQKMDSIVRGYNKALLKGKVDMESLNMIAEAGVPIFGDLGKVIGKTGDDMFKAISDGEVKTGDLTKAFERMTGKGGMFYRGMDIASQTLSGRISTLKDNVSLAAAEVGSVFAPHLKEVVGYLTKLTGKIKEWIIANKDLIAGRLKYYIKWLVDNFDEIVEKAKLIGKGIVVFYALTTAIKIATAAMKVFQFAMNINLGPAKKAAAFMKTDMTAAIGSSTKAAGGLTKAFGALGAFAAGWEIGDIIREKLVDPIIEAQFQLHELAMEVADTQRRDLTKRSSELLKRDLATVDKTRNALEKDVITSYLPGMGFFKDMGRLGLNKSQQRLESALASKSDALSEPTRPSVDISSTSTERIERSEVTIKDETGRARKTKGKKGKGFKLVHSGAMP